MQVFRADPTQRGFSQPCPLWAGQCTIYNSRHYPHVCRAYKCTLLKDVIAETRPLADALERVARLKAMIANVEARLPASPLQNFRERLAAFLEHPQHAGLPVGTDSDLCAQAASLLQVYESDFGVDDVIETPSKPTCKGT